jgi:hypothetical protein
MRKLVIIGTVVAALAVSRVVAAAPSTAPGTYGPRLWYLERGDGHHAIQLATASTATSTSTAYQAQVQQPINPDGSSGWSARRLRAEWPAPWASADRGASERVRRCLESINKRTTARNKSPSRLPSESKPWPSSRGCRELPYPA